MAGTILGRYVDELSREVVGHLHAAGFAEVVLGDAASFSNLRGAVVAQAAKLCLMS